MRAPLNDAELPYYLPVRLYEKLASSIIGTPLQTPAERLRRLAQLPHRLRHPEMAEIYMEPGRIDAFLRAAVQDGMNCIDAGCHLGAFLQRLVTLSPSGRHIAVEPLPYKADWLRRKFRNVEVHQCALGDAASEAVHFFYNARHSAVSGLKATLISIAAGRKIGFLKIDVEGAELSVLLGAAQILAKSRPVILFECTRTGLDSFGLTPAEVHRHLRSRENSMRYPFQAFNYVALPHGR